jgi:hypothetical protein
VRDLTYLS